MKKSTKRIVWGSGLAIAGAAAAGAVSYITTKNLVNTALDREMPKNIKSRKKISGNYVMPENLSLQIQNASQHLKNSNCEKIKIISHDGTALIGHWHHNQNDKRIIIAMHGWRSSWIKDFCAISDFWHNNKCSVLYAEQRGQNNSGGNYMGFGMIERYDCFDWIKWVNKINKKELPIYLAGISMGSSTVLMTAGLNLPKNVHGIIADCGYTSAHAIWKHVAENNMHLSYGIMGKIADDMCRKKINIGADAYSTVEAMANNNSIPVLFIHGTDDRFVPVEMTYENYKACKAPKKLLIVPGAEHCMSYLIDKKEYEHAVIDFWKKYDKGTVTQ